MKFSPSYSFQAILAFFAYILITGGIIFCNTALWGLGDPKFGPTGWQFYWPVWSILYAPITIAGLILAAFWRIGKISVFTKLSILLAAIISCLEASFIADAQFPLLIGENIALLMVFIVIAVFTRTRREQSDT